MTPFLGVPWEPVRSGDIGLSTDGPSMFSGKGLPGVESLLTLRYPCRNAANANPYHAGI